MLLRLQAVVVKVLALRQRGQLVLAIFVASPDLVEAIERQDRTVGAENVVAALDLDLCLVIHGGRHTARHEPAPDEVVELVLVRGKVLADRVRGSVDIGRPDRLVRILRARRGLGGSRRAEVPLAVRVLDPALDLGVGIGRDPGRVRAHVGDQPCGTFGSELDSLIQLLGHAHGGKRAHPKAAGRVLLHGRRDVWRVRALGAALLLDPDDAVARAFQLAQDLLGFGFVVDLELRVGLGRSRCGRTVEPRHEMPLGSFLGQLRVDRP